MSNIKKKYKYLDREEINKIARQLIKDIGIKINIQGFKFWCTAITMEFDNEETEKLKMMEVYSKISIKYKTTMSKVERAMRY